MLMRALTDHHRGVVTDDPAVGSHWDADAIR